MALDSPRFIATFVCLFYLFFVCSVYAPTATRAMLCVCVCHNRAIEQKRKSFVFMCHLRFNRLNRIQFICIGTTYWWINIDGCYECHCCCYCYRVLCVCVCLCAGCTLLFNGMNLTCEKLLVSNERNVNTSHGTSISNRSEGTEWTWKCSTE